MKMEDAVNIIYDEYKEASQKFGDFHNAHEGYSVILEEMDELWNAIKDKKCGTREQAKEAKQVGAMALRFLVDLC